MSDNKASMFENFGNSIFWCKKCNIPLLEEPCGLCHEKGIQIELTPPGDVRFASPHDHMIINELIQKSFDAAPLDGKLILLNKIPGEDKTDEILVDGIRFGALRFDMKGLVFKLDLMIDGAKALMDSGILKKQVRISSRGKHLGGKTIDGGEVLQCSIDIEKGDTVLVTAGNLKGFGVSYRDSSDLKSPGPSIKVKKIDSGKSAFLSREPTLDEVIRANAPYMKRLVKDATNTI
ncbi:MAG: phosphoadenosine phosphosulfate reductase, partial [Candidatus Methanoperedens sp.]|nr:phosphoadenosine phosphosulfate reductase [Candidatus Methanoperedens sp.]